jgi:hypothetical protein
VAAAAYTPQSSEDADAGPAPSLFPSLSTSSCATSALLVCAQPKVQERLTDQIRWTRLSLLSDQDTLAGTDHICMMPYSALHWNVQERKKRFASPTCPQ